MCNRTGVSSCPLILRVRRGCVHNVHSVQFVHMIGQITTWWKYRNLFDRITRRKTIYFYDPSERVTIGYQLQKNGTIFVVEVKHNEA